MTADETALIGDIYEAGAMPERWPTLLQGIADRVGARGGMIFLSAHLDERSIASPGIAEMSAAYVAEGWAKDNVRIARLVAGPPHAGFLTDLDVHTEEEVRTWPVYAEFLNPRGGGAGAATLIQGAGEDSLMLTIEAFEGGHPAARGALGGLDLLRPHLARAAALSGQLRLERARGAVLALAAIGAAAAMLDGQGRVQAANEPFAALIGGALGDGRQRLRLFDAASDARLAAAIARLQQAGLGSSIGFARAADVGMAALHIVPLTGDARDLFSGSAAIALIADVHGRASPNSDLLQTLFDLTPAEARVARRLTQGARLSAIALDSGVTTATVRSQLKRIFQKTLTGRQSELVALLMQLGRSSPA